MSMSSERWYLLEGPENVRREVEALRLGWNLELCTIVHLYLLPSLPVHSSSAPSYLPSLWHWAPSFCKKTTAVDWNWASYSLDTLPTRKCLFYYLSYFWPSSRTGNSLGKMTGSTILDRTVLLSSRTRIHPILLFRPTWVGAWSVLLISRTKIHPTGWTKNSRSISLSYFLFSSPSRLPPSSPLVTSSTTSPLYVKYKNKVKT